MSFARNLGVLGVMAGLLSVLLDRLALDFIALQLLDLWVWAFLVGYEVVIEALIRHLRLAVVVDLDLLVIFGSLLGCCLATSVITSFYVALCLQQATALEVSY